jgi:Spy/CpxP family protein refolding chaperone
MNTEIRSRSRTFGTAASTVALLALAFAIVLVAGPVRAQSGPTGPGPHGPGGFPGTMGVGQGEDQVDAILARMKARLKLTPGQEKQLKPILEENAKKLRELRQAQLAKNNGQPGPPDPELRKAMTAQRSANEERVAKILTPAQMEEWNKMRAEARQRAEQHMQDRPGAQGGAPGPGPHGLGGGSGTMGPGHGDGQIDTGLEQIKTRLKLTPEQETQLKPILEENARKLRELRQAHLAKNNGQPGPPDPETRKELEALRTANDATIAKILTPAQMEEWNKMRAEARQRAEQRMQAGPGSNAPPPAKK